MRSRAPSLHSATATRLPDACSAATWRLTASNTLAFGSARSAAKLRPGARADVDHVGRLRHGEGRQPRQRRAFQALVPFTVGKIEPVRRQRLVGRRSAVLERTAPRLVIIGDRRQPLARGILGQMLGGERRARQIVEQRFQLVVEQRQPMLHAGIAAAFAHRFVQQIAGRGGAEFGDIAGAEAADGFGDELEFGDRHQIEPAQRRLAALRLRVEGADRLQRVAEEIEPHR